MAITSAIMQMRRGLEADFDPDKMKPGEWAVSLDKKYVRMCFSPGVCVRMATYDAFEKDMEQIKEILSTCETIEEAVSKINTEVSANAQAVEEYTEQAKQYRDEAKQFRDEAEQFAPDGYEELKETVASNTAKIDTIIEKAELNIKNTASGENIHLTDSANSKVVEFGLYGKATQDGEPTSDNPIEITVSGSDGSVEVVSHGKNLLEHSLQSVTVNGVSATVGADRSIKTSGTTTAAFMLIVNFTLPVGKYVLSGCPIGGSLTGYNQRLDKSDGTNIGYDSGNGLTFELTEETNLVLYTCRSYTVGTSFNNLTFYPMIRLASDTDDTYEPYKETVSTIQTPDGLAGIPVESGGNYTDENGQQWITDVIYKYADGSGKRIQRIGNVQLTEDKVYAKSSSKNIDRYLLLVDSKPTPYYFSGFCTFASVSNNAGSYVVGKFHYDTNMGNTRLAVNFAEYGTTTIDDFKAFINSGEHYCLYVLPEPIITDLSAEEIAEIEKLYTFYPVTNISNNADCGMAVTYIADSKLYIDNQLAIQKAQQEEALATMLLLMPEEVQASMIENDTNNLLNESEV